MCPERDAAPKYPNPHLGMGRPSCLLAVGQLLGRSHRPPPCFLLGKDFFQPLGLIQIVGFSPFLFGFGFYLGVGFPLSGTGALFAFLMLSSLVLGSRGLVMGGFAYVSHANIVCSCTERHSNH